MELHEIIKFLAAIDNVSWGEKLSLLVTLWFMLKRIESNIKTHTEKKITEAVDGHESLRHGILNTKTN